MPCYVISSQSSERRSRAISRFNRFNYQFFDALTELKEIEAGYDFLRSRLIYNRKIRTAEAGCALSHYKLLKKIFASGAGWALVLEDDAAPGKGFQDLLAFLGRHSVDIPVVLILGHAKTRSENLWWQRIKQPISQRVDIGGLSFGVRPGVNFFGALAYVVNAKAAGIMSDLPKPFWLADDWMLLERSGICVLHALEPIVYEDLSFESSTGNKLLVLHDLLSPKFFAEVMMGIKGMLRSLKWKVYPPQSYSSNLAKNIYLSPRQDAPRIVVD